ncbi:MAG: ABC transporter ATP-binding protein [Oligoflexales bacterium]
MENVIEVQEVCRDFGDGETLVQALKSLSVDIKRGEFTAVVGPSGSGKSTLLHLVGGLDKPSSGQIRLAGKAMSEMTGNELSDYRRDHIGFVFQAYNLIPVLSVEENVEYVMLLQGVSPSERRDRVHSMLKRLGLGDKYKRFPNQLSGGQQQRVAVARAMVSHPDIILADEPTANLDSKTGGDLLDLMKELHELEKMTFLFSTHDPMVMERAERLIRLKDGEIAEDS